VSKQRFPLPQRYPERKQKRPASLQAVELLVAGTGFEPVTFGL
jgi:hypothetical protein